MLRRLNQEEVVKYRNADVLFFRIYFGRGVSLIITMLLFEDLV
jgi:hypothetical protein